MSNNTKVKSKAKTAQKVEMPKNPNEYSYRGDEMIPVPANVFLAIYKANEIALRQGIKIDYPTATEWVSKATEMEVKNPKEIDIKEGRVTQVMSIQKTFSRENAQETFADWLYPEVIQVKDALIGLHAKAVEAGIAVHISVLEKEREAMKKKNLADLEAQKKETQTTEPSAKKEAPNK